MKNKEVSFTNVVGTAFVSASMLVGRPVDVRVAKYGVSHLGRMSRMAQNACDRVFDVGVTLIAANGVGEIAGRYLARRQGVRKV